MTQPNHVPCWLYHSEQGAKIFTTQADLDEAIAQGWADSPAAARGQAFTDPEPGPDDGVVAALEAAEAAIEQGETGAIKEALEAAEEAIEKVQVVVSKKRKRRS